MNTLIYTCYAAVVLLGDLNAVDQIVKNIQPVFSVHGPTHRPEDQKKVSVSFLISITGVDREKTKGLVSDPSIVFEVAKRGGAQYRTQFRGCASQSLSQ